MKRPLAWLLGAFALLGFLHRRREPPAASPVDPRAEELRRKLDESRTIVEEREEFEAAETPVDEVPEPAEVEDRRKAVHERGRAAADEMRGSSPD